MPSQAKLISIFLEGLRDRNRSTGQSPGEYIKATANREILSLSQNISYGTPEKVGDSDEIKTCATLIDLYRKLLQCADDLLPSGVETARPTLWHWDLHAPNIFVKGNKITSVIDWQENWIGPLMLHSLRPPLLELRGESMLELPSHYRTLPEGDEKQQIQSNVESSILLFSYESQLQHDDETLREALQTPQNYH